MYIHTIELYLLLKELFSPYFSFLFLLLPLFQRIPMPVLYGIFLFMGISSMRGIQMFERLSLLFMPVKYQPDYPYLRLATNCFFFLVKIDFRECDIFKFIVYYTFELFHIMLHSSVHFAKKYVF